MKKLYIFLFIILVIVQGIYWFDVLNSCIVMPFNVFKCCRVSSLYLAFLFLVGIMFFAASMASSIPPNKKISQIFSHCVFLSGYVFSLGFSVFSVINSLSLEKSGIRPFASGNLIPYEQIELISITATRYPFIEKAFLKLKNGISYQFFSDFSNTDSIFTSRGGLYCASADSIDRMFSSEKISVRKDIPLIQKKELTEKDILSLLCSVEEYSARILMQYKNTRRKLTEHIEKLFASEDPVKRLEILSKYGKNISSTEEQAEFVYLLCCNSIDSFQIINNDYRNRKTKSYRRQYDEVYKFICKKYNEFPLEQSYCSSIDSFVYPGREIAILAENFPDSMYTYLALGRAAKLIEPATLTVHMPLVEVIKNWYDKKPAIVKAKSEAVVLSR